MVTVKEFSGPSPVSGFAGEFCEEVATTTIFTMSTLILAEAIAMTMLLHWLEQLLAVS